MAVRAALRLVRSNPDRPAPVVPPSRPADKQELTASPDNPAASRVAVRAVLNQERSNPDRAALQVPHRPAVSQVNQVVSKVVSPGRLAASKADNNQVVSRAVNPAASKADSRAVNKAVSQDNQAVSREVVRAVLNQERSNLDRAAPAGLSQRVASKVGNNQVVNKAVSPDNPVVNRAVVLVALKPDHSQACRAPPADKPELVVSPANLEANRVVSQDNQVVSREVVREALKPDHSRAGRALPAAHSPPADKPELAVRVVNPAGLAARGLEPAVLYLASDTPRRWAIRAQGFNCPVARCNRSPVPVCQLAPIRPKKSVREISTTPMPPFTPPVRPRQARIMKIF